MSAVNFVPWIGPEYSKIVRGFFYPQPGGFVAHEPATFSWGTKHKILMLGESHLLWEDAQSYGVMNQEYDYNPFLINSRLNGQDGIRTHATAGAVITGDYNTGMVVYNEIAFMNFFQEFIGNSAIGDHADKNRLTPPLNDQSCLALDMVLDVLKPNLVIAWGIGKLSKNPSGWLPYDNHACLNCKWSESLVAVRNTSNMTLKKNYHLNVWTYDKHPYATFWAIEHPSHTGFSYNYWNKLFLIVKDALLPV